jgi:phenylacetate-CoA ligase
MLFPEGSFNKITTISATSGSTGEPFYFPRTEEEDWQYEYVAELFLKNQFEIDKKRTLAIIGFGLGIWIGGLFSYKILNRLGQKGYKISVAPVGTNKQIFLETVKKMAQFFDQIILMGYPPFIKDIIDEAQDYQIDWKEYTIKIITAAEGFSEKFRDYLVKKTKIKNKYRDILNIYGTVELGTMAHETPLSVLIREILLRNPSAYKKIMPEANLIPTLCQYHPYLAFFEAVSGEVLGSGMGSVIPLLRYQFFDRGGVIPFEEMVKLLKSCGVDISQECQKAKIEQTIMRLPFVYVFERSDFAVVLRGANIFPENIKTALQNEVLEDFVTGKFTMVKRENEKLEEYLEVNVELKKNLVPSSDLEKKVADLVLKVLLRDNSEFTDQYRSVGAQIKPVIILHQYEEPKFFRPGTKQKWVKKN